jgi:general secretion pathway protein D
MLVAGILLAGCATLHVRRGDEFAAAGRWDEAVAAYRQAAEHDPFDKDVRARLDGVKADAAEQHYVEGKAGLKDRQFDRALTEFQLAVALDPSRPEYHRGMAEALRLKGSRDQLKDAETLRYLGRLDDALVAFERAVALDPDLTEAVEGITTVAAQRRAAKAMAKSTQPVTLRFQKAKLREVFEILARTAGVNVVFDKDVRDDPVTIFLKDMPYDDALTLILNTNNLVAHHVTPDTILIAPNTKQKRAHYQDLMIRTFYLSNAEAKKVVNLLRSMLESKRVFADEAVNAVVVRDTPAKLHLAERVIYSIDRRQPEVVLEVEVLEVDRTTEEEFGLSYAKEASFGVLPPSIGDIIISGSGLNAIRVSFPTSATLDFFKQEAHAKTLASPRIRVLTGEKATINVGDKQPILLSTTNVLPTSLGGVPTTSTVTSTEFKDTGVKLIVEPRIHLVNELTLKLKIEVTRLGEEVVLQAEPLIQQFKFGSRTAETTLRVRDGETVVLAGLIANDRRKTEETVSWLGDIPILGDLLTHTNEQTIETEIILTITPHIVRRREMPGLEAQAFWSGTQNRFSTEKLFSPAPAMMSRNGNGSSPEGADSSNGAPGQGGSSSPAGPPQPSGFSPGPTAPSPRTPGPQSQVQPPGSTSDAPVGGTGGSLTRPGPQPVPDDGPLADEGTVVAGGAGVLAIQPSRLFTKVGHQFRVDLTAARVGNFTRSVVTISYDPRLLKFLRISEGALLEQSTGPSGATLSEKPEAGTLVLEVRRQGSTPSVSGTLASLFFEAQSPGTGHLVIVPMQVVGAGGETFRVTATPGSVVVR